VTEKKTEKKKKKKQFDKIDPTKMSLVWQTWHYVHENLICDKSVISLLEKVFPGKVSRQYDDEESQKFYDMIVGKTQLDLHKKYPIHFDKKSKREEFAEGHQERANRKAVKDG